MIKIYIYIYIYTHCGVCVKSSDMHPDEVKDTPKELRYYVKMEILFQKTIHFKNPRWPTCMP